MRYFAKLNMFLGMVTVTGKKDVPQGACVDQQNVWASPIGSLSTRPGFVKFTTSELSGNVIGIYGYTDKSGTFQMIQNTDSGKIIVGTAE